MQTRPSRSELKITDSPSGDSTSSTASRPSSEGRAIRRDVDVAVLVAAEPALRGAGLLGCAKVWFPNLCRLAAAAVSRRV
jgi:hypothetical protein